VSLTLPTGWDQRDVGSAYALQAGPPRMPDAGVAIKLSDQAPVRPEGAQPVKLGRLETWRTQGISLDGGGSATRYLAPTSEGSLVITCFAPAVRSAELLPRCERAAATISLHSGRALALDTTIASDRRLVRVADELAAERAARRDALAEAEKRSPQSRAARSLARLYDTAASELRGEPMATTLTATAEAYRELALAAKGGDEAGWNSGRDEVERQEAQVDKALKKAEAAG